jgi:ABC-2 type transport system permease protein
MKSLLDAWTLAAKDLRMFVRDRPALILTFAVPIALVTVFGWIMTVATGGGSGIPKVTLWLVDEDGSSTSQQVIASLRQSDMLKVQPDPNDPAISADQLRAKIADGDAHHGIIIPKGFGTDDPQGKPIDLRMVRDPGRMMEDRMIQMALMQATFGAGPSGWRTPLQRMLRKQSIDQRAIATIEDSMNDVQEKLQSAFSQRVPQPANATADESADESANESADESANESANESADELADEPATETANESTAKTATADRSAGAAKEVAADEKESALAAADPLAFMSQAMALDTEDISPPTRAKQVSYQQAQSISGMSVMMMLFGLTGAGALLIGERESGTLRRLFALPIARSSVLLGKFLFVWILGMVQMTILFIYGEAIFRVGLFRDPLTLIVLMMTWVAAASGFAMLIATATHSAKQADGLSTVIILAMAALGGCWFPLQLMDLPPLMVVVTRSVMTFWAMDGLQRMTWNNLSLADGKLLLDIAIQWLWAIGLTSLSLYFFNRNYARAGAR